MGLSPRRFEPFPLRSYIPRQSQDKAAPLPLFTKLPRKTVWKILYSRSGPCYRVAVAHPVPDRPQCVLSSAYKPVHAIIESPHSLALHKARLLLRHELPLSTLLVVKR